jgi:hypothetical protein
VSLSRPPKKRRPKKPTVMLGPETMKMKSYLERVPFGNGWALFFCRGERCPRGPAAKQLAKHMCTDCVMGQENETMEQLAERIRIANSQ